MTTPAKPSVWILGDQLTFDHPALTGPGDARVVMIESRSRMRRVRYHSHKLVLIRSAMRHHAEALRGLGYEVDYRHAADFRQGLREHGASRLVMMASSDYNTRAQQERLGEALGVATEIVPNAMMLSNRLDPDGREQPVRGIMETFYRGMRRRLGLLVDERGRPEGGEWNYDAMNRAGWPAKRAPEVPPVPLIPPDEITQAAIAEVAADHPEAFGDPATFRLGVTRPDALALLDDFITLRLPLFGRYEDAMSDRQTVLYHSQLSPYLNIGLLSPLECAEAAVAAYKAGHAPLNAVEGFLRQIVGWREYMYQRYWEMMPGLVSANHYHHTRDLPPFFWGDGPPSELRCLQSVIDRVLEHGWSHHIERLMVVGNWCLLAGIDPAQVNDWFLATYIDAYDWVVPTNVIGMSLYADGGRIGTKPYVASGSYIHKQSDFCERCRYDPKQRVGPDACPFNALYWRFVSVHQGELAANARTRQMTFGLGRIADLAAARDQAEAYLAALPRPGQDYAHVDAPAPPQPPELEAEPSGSDASGPGPSCTDS